MDKFIMMGIDVHEANLVIKWAYDREPMKRSTCRNQTEMVAKWVGEMKAEATRQGADAIYAAYEASGLGFVLCDQLIELGVNCYVLAPSKMEKSTKDRKRKFDERDAEKILEILKGHLLAGNKLPWVWIPGEQVRDDRNLVRARLDVGEKISQIKTQAKSLLKQRGVEKPAKLGECWGKKYRQWLQEVLGETEETRNGLREALGSLLRQLEFMEREENKLEKAIRQLSQTERYRLMAKALKKLKGVGQLTAMTFLTELGDMERFKNRKEVGAYLGLTPSSNESGETNDKKGHITHEGPARLRKVLCQAAWGRVGYEEQDTAVFNRICDRNPKHRKIGIVAVMRRLGILMWHVAKEAQKGESSTKKAAKGAKRRKIS